MSKQEEIEVVRGSGNVFADLGLCCPEIRLERSLLEMEVEALTAAIATQVEEIERLTIEVGQLKCGQWESKDKTITTQAAQLSVLADAVTGLAEMVGDWSCYASDYFKEKHGLADDLAKADRYVELARQIKGEV
jgi:hypothetical protein